MKRRILATCAVLVASLIGFGVVLRAQAPANQVAAQPGSDVLQRRIASTVRESGELQSASNLEIRCEVPGKTAILFAIREGSPVKKGDLLIKLDSSAIENEVDQQRIVIGSSAAFLAKAESQLKALERQRSASAQIRRFQEKAAALAQTALLGKGGELDGERRAAEGELKVYEARLLVAQDMLAGWKKGNPDQPVRPDIRLAITEAEVGIANAARRRKFIQDVRMPQAKADLVLEQALAGFKLSQQLAQVEASWSSARATVAKSKLMLQHEAGKLKRLERNLAKCVIRAPAAGTVVHANRRSTRGSGSEFVVEVGAIARDGQTLMMLPDLTKMQLRTLINETRISRVRVGQTAVIRFDALPDRAFAGTVKRVNRFAEPTSWFTSQVKEYAVLVELTELPRFARIGLSAVAEINVNSNRRPRRRASPSPTKKSASRPRLNIESVVDLTLSRYDKNSDSKLEKDELAGLNERQRKSILVSDTNGDGTITKAELMSEMIKRFRNRK